jgi:hypothetical protein
MAVDKSFVVKNGLEVNSDLIVADASSKKVGIASTGPRSTLDVRGGIAATDINITGIATIANLQVAAGDVDFTNLKVTGFSTLGGLTVDQLTVTGFTTFTDLSYDEITGRNLNLTGIATIPVIVGIASFTDAISSRDVNVSGVATITTANVTTANVTTLAGYPNFSGGATVVGTVTAAHFSGGGLGVGIKTTGSVVGYGFTMLNFVGSGNTFAVNGTTVDISIAGGGGGGSASIGVGSTPGDAFTGIITDGNLWYNTGLGRLFIYYQDDNSAQWVDAAPFNVGIITTLSNVSFDAGSVSSPAISFGSDDNTGFYLPADEHLAVTSNGSEVARFNPSGVNVTGIATATAFKVGAAISISDGAVSATRFHGDGSNLTGIDATSLKDSGGNVKAQANPAGVVVTGVLTATSFAGDGSGLTGVASTDNIQTATEAEFLSGVKIAGVTTTSGLVDINAGGQANSFKIEDLTSGRVVLAGTGGEVEDSANLTFDGSNLVVSGNVSLGGTLTYQDVENIDSIGIITAQQGIQVLANGLNVTGFSTFNTGVNVTGVVTATSFSGDGSALTGIEAAAFLFNTGVSSSITLAATGIGTTALTLPSTAGKQYIVHSILASNVSTGNTEVNFVGAFDFNSDERSYFAKQVPIPTGMSVEMLKQPQVLNPSDRITVRSTDYDRNGTDGIIDVFISFEEKTSTDLVGLGKGVSIAATTAIGIFTSTSNPSVIQSIRLANVTDAGGKVASIIVNDGVTDRFIVDNLVVPKYASIEVLDNLKRIETNHVIKIQVDEAQTIDVQLSAKKITS